MALEGPAEGRLGFVADPRRRVGLHGTHVQQARERRQERMEERVVAVEEATEDACHRPGPAVRGRIGENGGVTLRQDDDG